MSSARTRRDDDVMTMDERAEYGGATPGGSAPSAGLPRGARDLLPEACRRRRAVRDVLLATFESWGYEPVITPAIEYFEVLARGLSPADRRGCVRFIAAGSGELVTLRADVTPQIARMLAQRWGGELARDVVHRFSYAARVLRQPTVARERTEIHQVGIELIGDDDPAADAELVALADASLRAVGLSGHRLDLAHTRVARGLLAELGLPELARAEVRRRLGRKDRDGVARLLAEHPCAPSVARATAALCDLFGEPETVLPRAEAALAGTSVHGAIAELQAVLEQLTALDERAAARITLDLGEVRGFDYYSGIRIRGWAPGVPVPLVRGGRYDGLLRRYGVPRPATGFAVDLDAVEAAQHAQGHAWAEAEPGAAHLVVLEPGVGGSEARARAHRLAREARAEGRRAWVQPGLELARAQQLAATMGVDRITLVGEHTATHWERGPQGWTQRQEAP